MRRAAHITAMLCACAAVGVLCIIIALSVRLAKLFIAIDTRAVNSLAGTVMQTAARALPPVPQRWQRVTFDKLKGMKASEHHRTDTQPN